MKRIISFFLSFWAVLLVLMMVQKPIFMSILANYSCDDLALLPTIMANGFTMDLAMSAYLLAPVALWLIAAIWVRRKFMLSILKVYIGFIAFFIATIFIADIALFPFWNFHIDATPIFYLLTAPAAAFASVSWWFILLAIIAIAAATFGIYKLLTWVTDKFFSNYTKIALPRRGLTTAVMTALTVLLIIPIRGGVTVSTMSPGRAYFCTDMHLNQAAVNPLFNFIHSIAHVDKLSSQFHYYDSSDVDKYIASLNVAATADSVAENVHLKVQKPDVYLIILESFSAHLLPSLGGEPVAMSLDSIANEGVLFTDFYAESFRTDRGLATILSGYPAMPTTSVFRYQNKFDRLPSLAMQLRDAGYFTSYYYGGDINFTNMNAYLVSTGFKHIVKDTDFAVDQRLSKWGVHDDVLFSKAIAEKAKSPEFRVIQTSSSHEPFEVPYRKLKNDRANAFAYADSCLGNYIRQLKASGAWQNALVIIVPDHWGAYPENLTDPLARQHIPLVLTGGAIAGAPARIANTGSQSAIAPTILSLLGIQPKGFINPRNLLDSSQKGFAWMAIPEWFGIKQGENFTQIIVNTGDRACGNIMGENQAKAFIQHVYNDLDKR
jgi:phosphoglycerol transferase MdoB-like AlkP superfamily enzyme